MATVVLAGVPLCADATTIDFDFEDLALTPGEQAVIDGDRYASQGIRLSTSAPELILWHFDGVPALAGATGNSLFGFSPSFTNPRDIIIEFVDPATGQPAATDHVSFSVADIPGNTSGGLWVARAFNAVGTNIDTKQGSEAGTRVTFDTDGAVISSVVFFSTSDWEGIDDLSYTPIPEPSAGALLVAGGLLLRRLSR